MAGEVVVVVKAGGDEVRSKVELKVEKPPQAKCPPSLLPNLGHLKDKHMTEGGVCVFRMPVKRGFKAEWYFNEKPLESNVKYTITQSGTEAVLEIPKVTSWDDGVYRVNLTDGKHSYSSSAQLIVEGLDPLSARPVLKVESFPRDQVLREGEDCRISVGTSGSPVASVRWFKNYEPISDSDERYNFSLDDLNSSYSLCIYKALAEDSGLYSVKLISEADERLVSCYLEVIDSETEVVPYRLISKQVSIQAPSCFFFNDCILTHDQFHQYKVVLEIQCQHAIKPFKKLAATNTQRRWFVKKAYVGKGGNDGGCGGGHDDGGDVERDGVCGRGEKRDGKGKEESLLKNWYVESSTDYEYSFRGREPAKDQVQQRAMFKQQMVQVVVVLRQPRAEGVWFKDGVPLVRTGEENKDGGVSKNRDGLDRGINSGGYDNGNGLGSSMAYIGNSDVNKKYKGCSFERGREHKLMVKDVGEADAGVYTFGVPWVD